jgi:Protein of unknown function (DUF3347)
MRALRSIGLISIHILLAGALFAGQGGGMRDVLPPGFLRGWDALVDEYLHIKDALVADNTWGASMAAGRFLGRLHAVDQDRLTYTHGQAWARMQGALRGPVDQIAGASGIDVQRKYFDSLSRAVLVGVERIGAGSHHLYRMHCPMALAGRGADWLSLHRGVQNPYFGVAMLRCGRVQNAWWGVEPAPELVGDALPGRLRTPVMHGCHGPGR